MTLLDTSTLNADPFALFHQWFEDAKSSESADADAACLATQEDMRPSARMVLVRRVDSRGFIFFTNENSRKGQQLAHGYAALCYHWKSLERQVRIEGHVETVEDAISDEYFAGRPRGSRIAAWASLQSEDLPSRAVLMERVAAFERQYKGKTDIPRPPHWHGYRVVPKRIEFWHQGEFRLHDRFVYTREGGAWMARRLFP